MEADDLGIFGQERGQTMWNQCSRQARLKLWITLGVRAGGIVAIAMAAAIPMGRWHAP